jgi:hypothetical protein
MENVECVNGEIRKRLGVSTIFNFNTLYSGYSAKITGFWRVNSTYAIVCVAYHSDSYDFTCMYRWDYTPEITASDVDQYYNALFTNHFSLLASTETTSSIIYPLASATSIIYDSATIDGTGDWHKTSSGFTFSHNTNVYRALTTGGVKTIHKHLTLIKGIEYTFKTTASQGTTSGGQFKFYIQPTWIGAPKTYSDSGSITTTGSTVTYTDTLTPTVTQEYAVGIEFADYSGSYIVVDDITLQYTNAINGFEADGTTPARWRFCNHFDRGTGQTLTIATDGNDVIFFDHDTANLDASLVTDGFDGAGVQFVGKYPASFYDALYLANVTHTGESPDDNTDPFGVAWSDPGVVTDFTDASRSMIRSENGTQIVSLIPFKNSLVLSKYGDRGEIWLGQAYANFERQAEGYGPQNHESIVSTHDKFWFADKGRILDIDGKFLSLPIHTLFAASNAGQWEIFGIDNYYNNRFYFSNGRLLAFYDFNSNGWNIYRFGRDIKLLGYAPAGKAMSSWIGPMNLHKQLSVSEEDIIADYYAEYSDGVFAMQNHYSQDEFSSTETNAINFIYETRTETINSTNMQRWLSVILQGNANQGPFTIKGWFGNSPVNNPSFETLGTITLDSYGYKELWINKRSKWCALRIEETNANSSVNLYKIGLRYSQHGYR